ncbi:MobP2 family relaxase [Enterococcus cecorum]|uniref:MobP2 family relaxase n=1 Tax=Enterococcus cecorum TaxID=44008 RepID=UPI002ACA70BD|nr:MobP2 family relaxase [Enterococcus cecorum]MDZ5577086.1 MobP2 family relaxase [Enterococcus cecorum]
MSSPSIVLTSQFKFSHIGKIFGGFLGYMGREEAIAEEKRREVSNSEIYFSETSIDEHIKKEISQLLHDEEKDFDGFLGYMKRSEAILNETNQEKKVNQFIESELFNEKYFEQTTKQYTGLFTANIDNLTDEEVAKYQEIFLQAQEADSFLWQDVVSFSEEFAKESGLIDSKTNEVAQSKIIEATRKMMQLSFEKENMTETGIWVASVHVNTDNLHVHVATVETVNTRPMKTFIDENGHEYRQRKGMRKQSTLDQMKYTFYNAVHSEKELLTRINELRNELVKEHLPKAFEQAQTNKEFQQLIRLIAKETQKIPQGKRKWAYKTQTKHSKEMIQTVVQNLLKDNTSYREFQEKASQYSDTRKEAFGQSKDGKKDNQNYYKRMEDLQNRLGNAVLKQIKALVDSDKKVNKQNKLPEVIERTEHTIPALEQSNPSAKTHHPSEQEKRKRTLDMNQALEKLQQNFKMQKTEEELHKESIPRKSYRYPTRKNYQQFSTKNQEKIQKAYGKKKVDTLTLFSEDKWERMHYEAKPGAQGVYLYVPKIEKDSEGKMQRSYQKKKYYDKSEMFTRYQEKEVRSDVYPKYQYKPEYRLSYRDFNHLRRLGYETYKDWEAEQFHQNIQRQIEWEQSRVDYGR